MPAAALRSFRGKLLLLVLVATLAAVIVQSAVVRGIEVLDVRPTALDELSTDAGVIATHSTAALAFEDANAARETLSALDAAPRVISARIFDSGGKLFAQHQRGDVPDTIPGIRSGHRFRGNRLILARAIEHDGENLGTLVMVYDLSGYYHAIWRKALISIVIAGGAVSLSMLAAMRLQRRLTRPMNELVRTSREISRSKDYSLRVARSGDDEIGMLTDSFNEMLAAIEVRDAELLDTQQELETSNQQLQQFAYVASHDLQEPLRKIQNFSSMITQDFAQDLPEDARDYLTRMNAAATRMRNLITDLLTYSRVASREPDVSDVDLDTVLQDILSDLEVRLEETGGTVRADPLPMVRADDFHMRQLFLNLIGNALKFHRPGVPPVVRISVQPGLSAQGRSGWRIRVEDNGIGFEQSYAERIFLPFQRLHRQNEYDGTGIGLAICRRIIDRYRWEIAVIGRPGNGAVFTITIPANPAEDTRIEYKRSADTGAAA